MLNLLIESTLSPQNSIRIPSFSEIAISIISMSVIDGIHENIGLAEWSRFDDAGGITLGICLILLSMVVRYGAELEQKNKRK